jgi:hypothetical protein
VPIVAEHKLRSGEPEMLDNARFEQLNRVAEYVENNPSTIGSGDPQVYKIISFLLDAVKELNVRLNTLEAGRTSAEKGKGKE